MNNQKYVRSHIVEAEPMTKGEYRKFMGQGPNTSPVNEDPSEAGYKVTYPDGYISWCPKAQFEAAGRPVDGMTFGMAVEMMKQGRKVARRGWNGKGMWLWLLPAAEVKREWCKDPRLLEVMGERDSLSCLGSIRMRTATGEVLTGWLASQTDILADDWCLVD